MRSISGVMAKRSNLSEYSTSASIAARADVVDHGPHDHIDILGHFALGGEKRGKPRLEITVAR